MDVKMKLQRELASILAHFRVSDNTYSFSVINQGYINDSYFVSFEGNKRYILQRVNNSVFKDVGGLMQNIEVALSYLHDTDYATIELVKTHENRSYTYSSERGYWRLFSYVPKSIAYATTSDTTVSFEGGKLLATFHQLLTKAPHHKFTTPLPKFHDLNWRRTQFDNAYKSTTAARIKNAKSSIDFVYETFSLFTPLLIATIPKRICHNDAKLNNMLYDSVTKKALALIDLDTLMPGYFYYDFGDAVRTLVNASPEDETDLERITFNSNLFEAFLDGIASKGNLLSTEEISTLHLGVIYMPFIHGLRALTDYLEGNRYYKVAYENQNLDRCRSLFKFAALSLQQIDDVRAVIIKKLK